MIRREAPGLYYVGIYEIARVRRRVWRAVAFGPGTVGDGSPREFPTLAAAYEGVTGEPMRGASHD